MDILKELGIKHNLNLKRIFNNPKVNFFIIANIVLFIGCYNFLDNSIKNGLTTILSYPIILFIISSICLLIGYYNIILGIILVVGLFTILYPNLNITNKDKNNDSDNDNDNSKVEGFTSQNNTSRQRYQERLARRQRLEANRERNNFRNKNTFKDLKNNFTDVYNELKEEYEDDLRQGMKENLMNVLSSKRKSNRNNFEDQNLENNSDINKTGRENFNDDFENESLTRQRRKETFRTIKKRKFNPNDENDANFLICKEILKDLLNRITYQYESKDYLKKYIEHRIEEMIDLFKFNDETD